MNLMQTWVVRGPLTAKIYFWEKMFTYTYIFLMFLKTGHTVSSCVDETGSMQINLKPDYLVENRAIGNTTFFCVEDLQDY